ncbi:MAG: DsrE family protein [Myxococcaceae bacterium]
MADKPFRVVFHLDEADAKKHESVLRNVNNLLDDLGQGQTHIELVAHGLGLDLLTGETGFAEQVAGLVRRGVVMAACNNTLRERGIARDRLLPDVTVVSSGVGELVRRQRVGWQYVRP